jgi:hypothetical protein
MLLLDKKLSPFQPVVSPDNGEDGYQLEEQEQEQVTR